MDLAKIALRNLNPIQDGSFRAAHGWERGGDGKRDSAPKICQTYPSKVKISTVIPYLKKTPKIYESRETPLKFC